MAYSKAVEDFAKEIHETATKARGMGGLAWAFASDETREVYRETACMMMQNGWAKKQASRDTIDWADARSYNSRGIGQNNHQKAFNALMDLTQAMAEWINDPECGHDYEGLLRMQKETRA